MLTPLALWWQIQRPGEIGVRFGQARAPSLVAPCVVGQVTQEDPLDVRWKPIEQFGHWRIGLSRAADPAIVEHNLA
jgi:hypothetical protein